MSLRTAARVTNSSKTAQYPMVFSTTFNETSTGLEDAHEAGSTSSSVTSPFLSPIRQKNNHWSASTSSNTSVAGSLSLGSYSSNVGSGSLSSLASSKYMQQQLLEARGDYPAGAGILQANFGTNPATASLLNRLNIRLDPALNIKGKVAKSPMRMQKQYEKSEKSVIAGTGTNSIASQSTESNNYQCRKQFASHPESPLRNNEISDFSDDLLDDVPTVSAGASVWPYSHLPGGVEYEDDNESTMSSITSASHAHNSGQAGGFSKHIVNAQAFPPPGGFEVISRNLNLHTSTGQPIHNQGQNTGIVEKLSPEFNGTVLTTSVAADTLFMGRELIGTVNNSDNYSTIMHSLKSSAVEQCINNSVGQILNSRSSRSSTCSVGSGELHSGSGKSASSGMALSHSSLDSFMNTQGAVEADVAVNQGRPPGDHGSPKGSLQSTLDMFRIGGSKGRGMRGTSNSKRSNTSSDSGTDTNKAVPRKNSPVKTSRSRGMNGGIPGTSLQSGFGVAPTSSTIQLPKLSSYGLSISSR